MKLFSMQIKRIETYPQQKNDRFLSLKNATMLVI
jgi:hypothetical protein